MIDWYILNFSSETAEWNSTKLDRKQDLNVLYQVCDFRADRKNKMAALASDWLRYFRLLWNCWTEFNETWQEARSQCLYQVCVFRADRKNKMAALAYEWLIHFQLLLWNSWMEFNETQQEARSQRPLLSLCFSGRSEKQDGRLGLWLAEIFSTSIKLLNGIQRNLTGSKISMPLPSLWFSGRSKKKTRWPPWPVIGWDIFWLLLWNRWTEFNETWQETRSQRPLPSLCFSGGSEKQDGRPGLWLAETFSTSMKLLNGIQLNLTGSKISMPLPSLCFSGRSKKQDGRPGLWLAETFSTSPLKPLNGLQQNLTERSQRPLPSMCCSGWSEKQDGRPGQSVKKVAHCTQVHDMWPFGPLVKRSYTNTDTGPTFLRSFLEIGDPLFAVGFELTT